MAVPRVLVIDDLAGRTVEDGVNVERMALCSKFHLHDVTNDASNVASEIRGFAPVAEATFCRGQQPVAAVVGDVVDNDMQGVLEAVESGWSRPGAGMRRWALVLLDLSFRTGKVTPSSAATMPGVPEGRASDVAPSDYFGLDILARLQSGFPELPVIILSAQPRDDVSRQYTRLGAKAFLPREAASWETLERLLAEYGLIPDSSGVITGESLPLLLALRDARGAARASQAGLPGNVLLLGERGTGKDLLARFIHRESPGRGDGPFLEVNCAMLTPELFGSELFGHVRGAFSGAIRTVVGGIVRTDGGDLLLDEVGDMPGEVQTGLLRVVEDGRVQPVGSEEAVAVDVRFLSATDQELEGSPSRFRPQLLDRLRSGGTIVLPPLRDRPGDIPLLVERFVREAEQHYGALPRTIDAEVTDKLVHEEWPGNVRELRTCLLNAVRNNKHSEYLLAEHLRMATPEAKAGPAVPVARTTGPVVVPGGETQPELRDLLGRLDSFPLEALPASKLTGTLPGLDRSLARFLARYVRAVVSATRKTTAACPEGEMSIDRAINLAVGGGSSGRPKLTTTKTADVVKRLLGYAKRAGVDIGQDLASDETLRAAFQKAEGLRRPKDRNAQRTDADGDGER